MLTQGIHRLYARSNTSPSFSRCGRPVIALVRRRFQQHAAEASGRPFIQNAISGREHRGSSQHDKRLKEAFKSANGATNTSDDPVSSHWWAINVRRLIKSSELSSAVLAYKSISKPETIADQDMRLLVAACLNLLKTQDIILHPTKKRAILSLIHEIVRDITKGSCESSSTLCASILDLYRHAGAPDDGLRFFNWIEANDDAAYLYYPVYAAAMQLQMDKGMGLDVMEGTYARALARFPGAFLSYHLSPDSVLPDRELISKLPNFPHSLCCSRLIALIKHGAITEAYKFLDVYMRLYPQFLPSDIVKAVAETRPLSEALVLVALAWNLRKPVPRGDMLTLVKNLAYKTSLPGEFNTVAYVRVMTTLMCHHIACNDRPVPGVVGAYIDGLASLARSLVTCGGSPEERQHLIELILANIERVVESFARMGVKPVARSLNAILANIAGHDMSGKALDLAQSYFTKYNLKFTEKTHRHLIRIGGLHSNFEVIEVAWKNLVAYKAEKKLQLGPSEFGALFLATTRAGKREFAISEYTHFRHALSSEATFEIDQYQKSTQNAEKVQKPDETEFQPLDQYVYESIATALAELSVLENLCAQWPNNDEETLLTVSIPKIPPPFELAIDETSMRKIYDEFTTIPEESESTIPTSMTSEMPPATSQENDSMPSETGESSPTSEDSEYVAAASHGNLADLRYENWKTMNVLLHLADVHEKAPPPRDPRLQHLTFGDDDMRVLGGFAMMPQEVSDDAEPSSPADVQLARGEIQRLRAQKLPYQVSRPEFTTKDA